MEPVNTTIPRPWRSGRMNWVASIWNLAFLNCDCLTHYSASLTKNLTGRINGIQLWRLLTTWESKTVDGRWSSWWGGHIISCVTWENSRHFTTPPVSGFPTNWRLRNERRNSILMTSHYPDLDSASDWVKQMSHSARPIRRTRHQYGISALVSQTSFR